MTNTKRLSKLTSSGKS